MTTITSTPVSFGPFPTYAPFLVILDEHHLYSPNLVIIHGELAGLLPEDIDEQTRDRTRLQLREFFLAQMRERRFPPWGDGFLPDHPNVRGWWGRRWKILLELRSMKALKRKYKHLMPNQQVRPTAGHESGSAGAGKHKPKHRESAGGRSGCNGRAGSHHPPRRCRFR